MSRSAVPLSPALPVRLAVTLSAAGVVLLAAVSIPSGVAQDKDKKDKKGTPRVIVVLPLGMKPGTTEKLTIRGQFLEGAKEIRFEGDAATAKIVSTGKAPVPDKNPERVGDTQIVAEVKLDAAAKENIVFVVVTPDGETKPHPILVETARPVIKEAEPNDGFKKPHVLKDTPVVVEGVIERPRDVDVFAITGKKGQRLRAETIATRHGSALDPHLTLYRSGAIQLVAPAKNVNGDLAIDVELPADDTYYLVVSDSLDQGTAIHAYRVAIEVK